MVVDEDESNIIFRRGLLACSLEPLSIALTTTVTTSDSSSSSTLYSVVSVWTFNECVLMIEKLAAEIMNEVSEMNAENERNERRMKKGGNHKGKYSSSKGTSSTTTTSSSSSSTGTLINDNTTTTHHLLLQVYTLYITRLKGRMCALVDIGRVCVGMRDEILLQIIKQLRFRPSSSSSSPHVNQSNYTTTSSTTTPPFTCSSSSSIPIKLLWCALKCCLTAFPPSSAFESYLEEWIWQEIENNDGSSISKGIC